MSVVGVSRGAALARAAVMTDAEPITRHVWLPDGRSLCDRYTRPAEGRVPTRGEFDAEVAATEAAPPCGLQLLVARLRTEAAAISPRAGCLARAPSAAWALLAGTRWAERLDVVAFSVYAEADDPARFDAIESPVDRADVDRPCGSRAASHERADRLLDSSQTPNGT